MPPVSKKPYKHANQNKKSRLRSSSTTSSYQSSCTETQCQTCFQWFTNLNSHLSSSNNSCASLPNNRLSNDPSLVTDIRTVNRLSKKKDNNNHQNLSVKNITIHQLDLLQSNDNDQNLFQVYVEDNDNFQHNDDDSEFLGYDSSSIEESNSISQKSNQILTSAQSNRSESSNEKVSENTTTFVTNSNHHSSSTPNKIIPYDDSLYQSLLKETSEFSLLNINNDLYFDFTKIQHLIKEHHDRLTFDFHTIHAIRLLKIMYDKNIPISIFSDLAHLEEDLLLMFINTSLPTSSTISSFPNLFKTKEAVMHRISSNILPSHIKSHYLTPIHKKLQLPSHKFTNITKFDLSSMILSLLIDQNLIHPSNMLLEDQYFRNPQEFENLPNSQKKYGDIHTGSWFLNAHNKTCRKDSNDVLCPLIIFIDGTPIDTYGNLKLEAIMFTLGIFNRTTRNKSRAWRLLGYVPNLEEEMLYNYGCNDTRTKKLREKLRKKDYHHMLCFLLEDLVKIQNSNGILWNYIDSNNVSQTVNLRFSLMFVIGDALGNDKLCDRFQSYQNTVAYLCRDCLCKTKDLENLYMKCSFTKRSFLKGLNESELNKLSYHFVENNIFDTIHFGFDDYGINGCTPCEHLHQFLLGIVKKLVENFFQCLSSAGLSLLTEISTYLSKSWSRQSDKEIPSISNFKESLNKSKLTGDEYIDLVFLLLITLSQTHVRNDLVKIERNSQARSKVVSKKTNDHDGQTKVIQEKIEFPKVGESLNTIRKWTELFERTLSFYEWLKQDEIPVEDLIETTHNSCDSHADFTIRDYLRLYKKTVFIPYGNGNQSLKDHQTMHIPHQIRRFGIPSNYDGGIGERHLKSMTKEPARMTQRRELLLSLQSCNRYYEKLCTDMIYEILVRNNSIRPPSFRNQTDDQVLPIGNDNIGQADSTRTNIYNCSGYYSYHFSDDGTFESYESKSKKKKRSKGLLIHNTNLVEEVYKKLSGCNMKLRSKFIVCFTSLKYKVNNRNIIFRADPSFHGKMWNDWCVTKWEEDDDNEATYFPARILMFIDTNRMVFDEDINDKYGRYLVVIRATNNDQRNKQSIGCNPKSELLKTYLIENNIRIVSCDAIDNNIYVLPDISSYHDKKRKVDDITKQHRYTVKHVITLRKNSEWSSTFIRRQKQNNTTSNTLITSNESNDLSPTISEQQQEHSSARADNLRYDQM